MKDRISVFSNVRVPYILLAYETTINGATRWVVWCKHCRVWHKHGPAEGHREAHCLSVESPYWKSGYNLAFAGERKA